MSPTTAAARDDSDENGGAAAIDPAALDAEARALARYLLDVDTPADVCARYREAHALLLAEPAAPADVAPVELARRHPWLWPYLDAGAGLLRPNALLRKKILLMVALLETTPELAARFEPIVRSPAMVIAALAWQGVRAAFRIAIGLPLFAIAARGAR